MKKLSRKLLAICTGLTIAAASFGYSGASVKSNIVASDTASAVQTAYSSGSDETTAEQAVYMSQSAADALNNISEMFEAVTSNYACEIDYKKMKINMLKAMLSSLDPYSMYMEPEQATDFKQTVDNSIVGIGVVMEQNKDKSFAITQVIKGSPAEKAGVRANDIIDSVDGYSASKCASLEALTPKVRGKEGTIVKLVVLRNTKKYTFSIKRAQINLPSVNSRVLSEVSKDMGYIQITQIAADTYNQFKAAEDDLKSKGIKKVVLDLRGNGGGYMSVATQICRDIIPKGKIGTEEFTGEPKTDIMSDLESAPFKFTVLIDKNTASAAEFIAGAIQDRGVGMLVGDKSYGKSVIQQMIGVNIDKSGEISFDGYSQSGNLGTIKLTIGKYYTPNGTFINGKGLKPIGYVQYASAYDYDGAKEFDYSAALKVTFKDGTKNSIVKSIEQKLKLLGYKITPNDVYDNTTTDCISKYQHDKKLKVTKYGVVDEVTLKKLDADIKTLSSHDLQLEKAEQILKSAYK